MELDPSKHLALVAAVQKQIELAHHNIFDFGRMQNVWREKEGRHSLPRA